MDKLERIKKEIERMLELMPTFDGSQMSLDYSRNCLVSLLKLTDTLQDEPVSEDLQEASITAADEDMQGRQIMEESNEKRQLYSRIFRRGFRAGANWHKEQMLKNAIDAHVNLSWNYPSFGGFAWVKTGLGVGDKCKLIIIKED